MAFKRRPASLFLSPSRHRLPHRLVVADLAFLLLVHLVGGLVVGERVQDLAEKVCRTKFRRGLLEVIPGLLEHEETTVRAVEAALASPAHRMDRQLKVEVDVFTNGILRPAHLSPQLETIHGIDRFLSVKQLRFRLRETSW